MRRLMEEHAAAKAMSQIEEESAKRLRADSVSPGNQSPTLSNSSEALPEAAEKPTSSDLEMEQPTSRHGLRPHPIDVEPPVQRGDSACTTASTASDYRPLSSGLNSRQRALVVAPRSAAASSLQPLEVPVDTEMQDSVGAAGHSASNESGTSESIPTPPVAHGDSATNEFANWSGPTPTPPGFTRVRSHKRRLPDPTTRGRCEPSHGSDVTQSPDLAQPMASKDARSRWVLDVSSPENPIHTHPLVYATYTDKTGQERTSWVPKDLVDTPPPSPTH